MTTQLTTTAQYRSAPANGIDIHYIEAGRGEPLVLLHGGMVSTNPIWAPTPVSYCAHMERLAEGFRVMWGSITRVGPYGPTGGMTDPAVHELRAWCPQLVFLGGA